MTFTRTGHWVTPLTIRLLKHTPTIAQAQVRHGVTGLLATIATAPLPQLVECLSFARQWVAAEYDGAQILGVHLEGPYFSQAQKGAQDPTSIRTPMTELRTNCLNFTM